MSHASKISISSSHYGKIRLKSTPVPDEPHSLKIETTRAFGSIKCIISDYKKFHLWQATIRMNRPTRLKISIDNEHLGIFFLLKNDLQYQVKGLDQVMLLQHQFDMFYVPNLQLECRFLPQTYIACGLNFKTSFFKTWRKLFTPLHQLLLSIEASHPARTQNVPVGITPGISTSLFNILHCNYSGELRKKYLDIKVTELTFQILQNISFSKNDYKMTQYDLIRMKEVRAYLLDNLTDPGTIRQLAHRFGLNDFKLKKGFRQVFGTSIYAFLLEERMQQALILIIETDLSIAEIAHLTGYSSISSFSSAFKNKFGYPPSTLRRGS